MTGGRQGEAIDASPLSLSENAAREVGDAERWRTVDELAELLGVGRDFVYEHAPELGGRRLGSGPKAPWRFRLEDVLAATTCQEIRGHSVESPVSARRRRQSSATGVPLLPIRGSR